MTRVLHLVGSPTDEFFADLSRLYAAGCLDALAEDAAGEYEHHIAYVTPDGRWRFPPQLTSQAIATTPSLTLDGALLRLRALRPDVAVPQLFCPAGMTDYRALLDVAGIPYVGNRADVMALGAHKGRTRAVVAAAGVRVPDGQVVRRGERPGLDLPVVVKPADADNSVGVTLVRAPAELDAALDAAFEHSAEVLVERYVELGREVRCGVVEHGDELLALPLEEYAVDTERKPVRGVEDKLARRGDGELNLVAKDAEHAWIVDTADPVNARVAAAARIAHRALGCRHYSLFDFRIDPAGEPWFLEAGLYCSFAPSSVVVVMAAAAGIKLTDLFADAVALARS